MKGIFGHYHKIISFLLILTAPPVFAASCDESTLSSKEKQQIKSFVQQAKDLVQQKGIKEASRDFMTPKYIKENLYIFVIDHNQYSLANGGRADFVGKDLKTINDAKESAEKIINQAKKGGGWVNYVWTSPKTHQLQCKTSWVTPLMKDQKSDTIYTVGAGIEHQ